MSVFSYVDFFVFFKQKTAYEMRISDWSSDVCSSDLLRFWLVVHLLAKAANTHRQIGIFVIGRSVVAVEAIERGEYTFLDRDRSARAVIDLAHEVEARSEEHTSELQSLMRNSYAVFCLTKKMITQSSNP